MRSDTPVVNELELSVRVSVARKGRSLAPVVVLEDRVLSKPDKVKWWKASAA
ncbi:hypothetical protein SEA_TROGGLEHUMPER_56 [Rhodococcus phage Trogglehumper]|uniref:Uncharacterized protein n=1 Tax=Rhodococcus phage Trogglehumper TaxID=3038381 RepID=A0AAF0K221_9CAUD|nr:hypothetical protein SEA_TROGGLEHUMPER_56 [Rhodococcus phage Trogglehumper]